MPFPEEDDVLYQSPPIAEAMEAVKFDHDKRRMDLLSFQALEGIADVLTHGAQKYGDRNWEKGMEWSRPFGAILRHLSAWWQGEDVDTDSGLSHLHHAACELMFLQHYSETFTGVDNRPNKHWEGGESL